MLRLNWWGRAKKAEIAQVDYSDIWVDWSEMRWTIWSNWSLISGQSEMNFGENDHIFEANQNITLGW